MSDMSDILEIWIASVEIIQIAKSSICSDFAANCSLPFTAGSVFRFKPLSRHTTGIGFGAY